MGRISECRVQGKTAGMREAVENFLASCHIAYEHTVGFLIQEIACLLAVFNIHVQLQAVFTDHRLRFEICRFIEAFVLFKAFLLSCGNVIALINPVNLNSFLCEHFPQKVIDHLSAHFKAGAADLGDQDVIVKIDDQSGQKIRFRKNQPAVGEIVRIGGFAEFPGSLQSVFKE